MDERDEIRQMSEEQLFQLLHQVRRTHRMMLLTRNHLYASMIIIWLSGMLMGAMMMESWLLR